MRVDSLSPGTRAVSPRGHRLTIVEHLPTGRVVVRLDGRADPLELAGATEVTEENPQPAPSVRLDGVAQLRAAATAEGRKPAERRADVTAALRHLSSAEIEEAAELGLPLWCEQLVRDEVARRAGQQADRRVGESAHLPSIQSMQEALRAATLPEEQAEHARSLLLALQTAAAEEPAREGVWSQIRASTEIIARRAAELLAAQAPTADDALRAVEGVVEALIPDPATAAAPLRSICPDVDENRLLALAPHIAGWKTCAAAIRLDSGLTAEDLGILIRLERGGRARGSLISAMEKAREGRLRIAREQAAAARAALVAPPDALAAPVSEEDVADASEPPAEAPAAQSGQDAQPAPAPEAPLPETWMVMERPDGMDRFARRPGQPVDLVDEVRYLPSGVVIQTTRPGAADRCALVLEAASACGIAVAIRGAETATIAPRPPAQPAPSLDQALALARTLAERAGFALSITLTPRAA